VPPLQSFQRAGVLFLFALLLAQTGAAADLTQDDINFRKETYVNKKGAKMPYRLFVPLGYDSSKSYPLLLWLHGGTGRGDDNIKQITRQNENGTHFWTKSDVQAQFPVFVLAPQCPANDIWADPEINQPSSALEIALEILTKVESEFAIDPDRVYIGGQSMGGSGVWSLLQAYPNKWAAALVLSAYDNFTNVPAISRVPLWVFQGDADQSVPVDLVRQMMQQLKKAHANLRYTEYHKIDHEVWNRAFAEPNLLPWLIAQKRGAPAGSQLGSGASLVNH
jgi:predicted peptidase